MNKASSWVLCFFMKMKTPGQKAFSENLKKLFRGARCIWFIGQYLALQRNGALENGKSEIHVPNKAKWCPRNWENRSLCPQ
ncbi:hypothetical protein CYJ36_20540 [Bacillus sp. UMB0893]|nr:hypothetical protein CYJ36_20540 [Bacillus sp. UMB0893]